MVHEGYMYKGELSGVTGPTGYIEGLFLYRTFIYIPVLVTQ